MNGSVYQSLKEEAFEANLGIPKHGLALFTWGNVSSFDKGRAVFAIKPSGVPYSELSVDHMVVVDLDGKIVEGKLRPSSDTPTHRVLYRSFDSIRGVVHTHSTHATAWAQSYLPLPVLGTTHADHSPGVIPCTKTLSEAQVRGDYEIETGNIIVETFKNHGAPIDHLSTSMVLVGGHGPFTWGKSAADALYNSVVLEEIAKIAILTGTIINNKELTALPPYLVAKHYERKHGPHAYYGQKQQ